MERLTKINKYGTVEPYIRLSSQSEADDWHNDCVKQLAHYEDLSEKGLLVELPCKVGDTVYRVSLSDVKEYKVFAINIGIRENGSSCVILTKNNRGAVIDFETIDFGKTIFLTRSEAEQALVDIK